MSQEAHEASTVDWDEDFKPKEEKSSGGNEDRVNHEWLKYSEPGEYHLRLIGNAIKYLKHRDPPFNFRSRVITHPSYKGEDKAWAAKFYPSKFFAMFCIDRRDGSIKILDRSSKFFEAISNYKKDNDSEPGAQSAPDFIVTVKIPKNSKGEYIRFKTEYSVRVKSQKNDLTEDECTLAKKMCHKVTDKDGKEVSQLQIIFRSTPLDKINERWDALSPEDQIKKEREEPAKEQVKEETTSMEAESTAEVDVPVAESSDDTDDLFGSDEKTAF